VGILELGCRGPWHRGSCFRPRPHHRQTTSAHTQPRRGISTTNTEEKTAISHIVSLALVRRQFRRGLPNELCVGFRSARPGRRHREERSARPQTTRVVESSWARLQLKLLDRRKQKAMARLATATGDCIELRPSTRRRHSTLGARTPDRFQEPDSTKTGGDPSAPSFYELPGNLFTGVDTRADV